MPGGFSIEDFAFDDTAQSITCPAEHMKKLPASRSLGFSALCRGCPVRSRCTTAKDGPSLSLHQHETLLPAARRQARTPQLQNVYRRHRRMVERCIAWLARGNRKVRYRGTAKNDHWLHHRTAALNLPRLLTLGLTSNHNGWVLA